MSLKGNTYWPASPRNIDRDENYIICFDFTSESFGPLMRLPFDAAYHNPVTLSCVREEKLAVLFSHDEAGSEEFEMWITTKIEAEEVTWRKFLRVINPPISCKGFFIDEEKKVAMGFDEDSKTFNIVGEAGCLKKLELEECLGRDVDWMTSACSYVRNLVNIKQPAAGGGKRKQQSEFKKQRYDQNMGRIVGLKKRSWVWQSERGRQRRKRRKRRHA